jgi:DNA adenine methylase
MPFYSPLRYPGGKRKLSNYIKLVVAQNGLLGRHYVEPYAGGAAVALALLFEGYVSHIHINDLSRSVYAFWYTVLNETDLLCFRIQSVVVTMDEWYRQRGVQEEAHKASLLDLGFSTFFLNRTNRSGIILGGVIGGKGQEGPYKLDARYNVENLIDRIRRVASHRDQISIYNEDAADFIGNILPGVPGDALVYLDPPYYSKGKDLYESNYDYGDHRTISELVANIQQSWIVTYDNVPEIIDLYGDYSRIVYHFHYSAADRYRGSEVMFFGDGLSIPPVDTPVRVSKRTVRMLQSGLPL